MGAECCEATGFSINIESMRVKGAVKFFFWVGDGWGEIHGNSWNLSTNGVAARVQDFRQKG